MRCEATSRVTLLLILEFTPTGNWSVYQKFQKNAMREYSLPLNDMKARIKDIELLTLNQRLRKRILLGLTKPDLGLPISSLLEYVIVTGGYAKIAEIYAFHIMKMNVRGESDVILSYRY